MFTSATQLSNATKASIDSHLAALNEFAAKALTTVAEVAELNMATAKASLEHASAAAKQVLAAKDAQEVMMNQKGAGGGVSVPTALSSNIPGMAGATM